MGRAPAVVVEVCCGSFEDALAAEAGGAHRVELCSALCVGGLTPSAGAVVRAAARLRIPVMVMVRPRAAGFRYSMSELAVMADDVRAAVDAGAHGVVFGALREDASVDRAACRRLRARARGRETVFHRAFDLTPDPFRALEELVDLGFTRVLTSGQAPSAARGVRLLARLQDAARGRIEVLPAGGIRPGTVRRLLAATGCRQVHLSAFGTVRDPSSRARPALGFLADHPPEGQFHRTDPAKVRAMLRAVCSLP